MDAFLLTASDHHDALERRLACRQEHFKLIDQLRDAGKALIGAALKNEDGKMIGSVIILKMTKDELDQYLKTEPYVVNRVWDKIEIKPCAIGQSFLQFYN